MSVKLVDPMPLHPLLCYPGTRTPLRAVGQRADGSLLWPLCGGDGEDDDADEGEGSDDEDESEEDADDDAEDSDDEGKKKGKSKKTGPVSREEYEATIRRLSAADKRRAEAEKVAAALQKEKDEKERKDKPELENVRKDLATITDEHAKLKDRFARLARENAFHTASAQEKISWHDPKVALRSADLEELEIDENGNIEGIREIVKALAKSKKFLVNSGKEENDDEEDKKQTRRGASGSGVGSARTARGKKNAGQLSDEELRKRFPALGRTR